MAYLAIKKVKGRFYAYLQESYREGGQVRTRTVEYFGNVDAAVADKVITTTRRKLVKMEAEALIADVRKSAHRISQQTRTQTAPSREPVTPKAKPADQSPETPPPPTEADREQTSSKANNRPLRPSKLSQTNAEREALFDGELAPAPNPDTVVMSLNGEWLEVDKRTGEVLKSYGRVITTGQEGKTLRPLSEGLKLPNNLEKYKVSETALKRTHLRYGRRLEALEIHPATLPDVQLKYGADEGYSRNSDGSYSVTIKRTPKNRQPINKGRLWEHYRQALSAGYLDAIERYYPQRFRELEVELSHYHRENRAFIFEAVKHSGNKGQRLRLSLQLMLWERLPSSLLGKGTGRDFGVMNDRRLSDWKSEAIEVLSAVQKSGWSGLKQQQTKTRAKIKSAITKRHNKLSDMNKLESLAATISGEKRKLLREIMREEAKLKAVQTLDRRIETLKAKLEGF